jgi:CheY-like chemotaxis protein
MTYKILIVDDSKLARMSVAKAMATLQPDWNRIEAANADDAIARVNEGAIDIALLDFNMPGRDGLVLAAELRVLNPKMPLAVVSANHQAEIVARAAAVGATFLQKPVSEQALGAFLDAAALQLRSSAG